MPWSSIKRAAPKSCVWRRTGQTRPLSLAGKQIKFIGAYGGTRYELMQVLRLVARGDLEPIIYRELPLEELAEAHRLLEARAQFGKIIIVP